MAPKTDWNPLLRDEFAKPYWAELQAFVAEERSRHQVFPPAEDVFAALHQTPYAEVDLHPHAHWLTEYYQVDLVEERDDGVWRAKLYGADWSWLRRLVLRNAGSITVIAPESLRTQVVDDARLALRAYDEDVTSD